MFPLFFFSTCRPSPHSEGNAFFDFHRPFSLIIAWLKWSGINFSLNDIIEKFSDAFSLVTQLRVNAGCAEAERIVVLECKAETKGECDLVLELI